MVFLEIFIISFLAILVFYIYGNLICNSNESIESITNYSLISIYGFINLSLIALVLNFFFPINTLISDLVFLFGIILGIYLFFKKKKKLNLFIYFFLISLISLLILSYSNINRPDAGLYHLPYVQILQENKILVGLSNLHFRFGHISILQYLSAIFANSIFPIEAINIPLGIIVAIFFVYFFSYFLDEKKNKELKVFLLFIILYSFYAFNRYSNFGNDVPGHLFFFIFIIKILEINFKKIDLDQFGSLILISTFAYMQKPFMLLLFLIILIIFIFFIKKDFFKLIANKKIYVSIFLIIFWTGKNFLISGCAIYPLTFTCLKNLSYVNENQIKEVSIRSEAWAKDWPNHKDNKNISQKKYLSNFLWVETWKKNHLKKVFEKFIPFVALAIILLILLLIYCRKKKISKSDKFIKIKIVSLISVLFSLIWFIKFPILRYGQSFLALFFISVFSYIFIKYVDLKKGNKLILNVIIISLILIITKNSLRIYKKMDIRNIYPNIHTLSELKNDNYKKKLEPIITKNKFKYFYSKNECMYNKAPCTNFNVKIIVNEILGYKVIIPVN